MKIIDTGIVYTNPKPYLRTIHAFHPTIVDLGDGEMLCEYSLGQAQEAVDHLGYQSRSYDDGKTWQFEGRTIPVDTVRSSCHTVRLSKTSIGLMGFGVLMWRDDPEKGMIINREDFSFVPMDVITIHSTDKGKTWSWPRTIEIPLIGRGFEICHSILELPDKTWLAPCATQRGPDGKMPDGRKAIVLISKDKGESWKDYGVIFDGTEQSITHWEVSLCHLQDNDLLAVAWAYHEPSAKHLKNRFAVSHDGGYTFEPYGEIGIDGQTCKVLRLRDGRVLLVYRRNDKPGMWAALFDFDGSQWMSLDETLLWDGGLSSSGMIGSGAGGDQLSALKMGFPQMVQLESGDVFVVHWCFEDWSCCIRWTKVRV